MKRLVVIRVKLVRRLKIRKLRIVRFISKTYFRGGGGGAGRGWWQCSTFGISC